MQEREEMNRKQAEDREEASGSCMRPRSATRRRWPRPARRPRRSATRPGPTRSASATRCAPRPTARWPSSASRASSSSPTARTGQGELRNDIGGLSTRAGRAGSSAAGGRDGSYRPTSTAPRRARRRPPTPGPASRPREERADGRDHRRAGWLLRSSVSCCGATCAPCSSRWSGTARTDPAAGRRERGGQPTARRRARGVSSRPRTRPARRSPSSATTPATTPPGSPRSCSEQADREIERIRQRGQEQLAAQRDQLVRGCGPRSAGSPCSWPS